MSAVSFIAQCQKEYPSMLVGQRAGWTHEEKALLSVPAIETRSPAIQFMTEFLYVLGYPGC